MANRFGSVFLTPGSELKWSQQFHVSPIPFLQQGKQFVRQADYVMGGVGKSVFEAHSGVCS